MTLKPDQMLSHYRVIEKIGEGGMGVVYRARDEKLRRDIALKVLPASLAGNAERRLRFLREARAAAAVNHANIATIHEVDEADGTLFLAMELVEGRSLRDHLTEGAMPMAEAIRLAAEVAEGLAHAHETGVIHRDIKPENVMVGRDNHAKILDFGLAKILEIQREETLSRLSEAETATLQVTRQGALMGTVAYMSPEQARGELVDARSDIFSFGTMLYEMVTGQPPFKAKSVADTLASILTRPATPPSQINPEVPPDLESILRRCLEKDSAKRYQRTDELVASLRELRAATATEVKLYRLSRAVRHSWPLGVAAAVTLAVVATVVWQSMSWMSTGGDPGTILILPLEVRSQEQGTAYLGRAFAESLAVKLAQATNLQVLPVPLAAEFEDSGLRERALASVELGAGRLLMGALTREGDIVRASLSLVDAGANRILWGTEQEATENELRFLVSNLSRDLALEMNAVMPKLYDYPWNITSNPELARSPLYLEVLTAVRNWGWSTVVPEAGRLVETFPDDPDALVLSLEVFAIVGYMEQKDEETRERANELLADLIRLDPKAPWEALYGGAILEWDGEIAEAIDRYTRILEREDLTPSLRSFILMQRGFARGFRKDPDVEGGLRDLAEATRLEPALWENHRTYGLLLSQVGRLEEALTEFRRAYAIAPSAAEIKASLAELLIFTENYDEAVPFYTEFCAEEQHQNPCAKLANALHHAGREEEARAAAEAAEALEDAPEGALDLAQYRLRSGDKAGGLRWLRRWVELATPRVPLRANYGLTPLRGDPEFEMMAAQQWPKAAAFNADRCASQPSRAACALQAVALELMGHHEEAEAAAAKAASLDETWRGCQLLAWYYACARNRDEVIRYLTCSRDLGYPSPTLRLGEHQDYAWIQADPEFHAIAVELGGYEEQDSQE